MNKVLAKFGIAFALLVAALMAMSAPGRSQTRHSRPPGANSQTPSSTPSAQAQAPAPGTSHGPAQGPAPYAADKSRTGTTSKASGGEEFFITTSVDAAKHQLVLKRPTEVTLLIQANDQTAILGENGEHLKLSDLRTGDTVFVTLQGGATPPLALRIRKGPMTVAELHRRYLSY
jgi:hypothetical protein